jgi:hypothetical protein
LLQKRDGTDSDICWEWAKSHAAIRQIFKSPPFPLSDLFNPNFFLFCRNLRAKQLQLGATNVALAVPLYVGSHLIDLGCYLGSLVNHHAGKSSM